MLKRGAAVGARLALPGIALAWLVPAQAQFGQQPPQQQPPPQSQPGRGFAAGPDRPIVVDPGGRPTTSGFEEAFAPRPPNQNASIARTIALEAQEYALGIGAAEAGINPNPAVARENAERAIGMARKALQLDNQTAAAYSVLGIAYRDTWRWAESEVAFAHGYTAAPDDPGLAHQYGLFSSYAGEHERAIAIAERSTALNPYSASAHRDLGVAFAFSGNARAASAALGQCVAIDPSNANCQLYLGMVYTSLGRPEAADALRAAERLLGPAMTPAQAAAIAHAYSAAGLGSDALRLVRNVADMGGQRIVGAGTRALVDLAAGDIGQAYTGLVSAVEKMERGEPDEGFLAMMLIKHNLLRDPDLEQSRFRVLRERIGGGAG